MPLVADLFLFCYERNFMKSLSTDKRNDMIDAFNSTSRYLDNLSNTNNVHFEQMVQNYKPLNFNLFITRLMHLIPKQHF